MLVFACAWLTVLHPVAAAESPPANAAFFVTAMRQFADQALAQGRDVYGKPPPLFVDGLNADTGEPVKWKWADGKEWVVCNLPNQQGRFRTLDGLTRLTGEARYSDAALETLRYAFEHLRNGTQNNGGLLAWGGHLAYNASDVGFAGNPGGKGRIHELKCFFPHYELMWEANPKATQELIENIWNGHVLDWATLDFNRHGSPDQRGKLWANEYRGGENYNIGFVDVTDQPYVEMVTAAKLTHGRLLDVHSGKEPPFGQKPGASAGGAP